MESKRGSEKYYIIISLILGIIILSLVFYFLFNEYFTQDEIDWETCRQSVVFANYLPSTTFKDFKDLVQIKCKTKVIEVDAETYEEVDKIISDTITSCWYMYGGEKFDFLASEFWGDKDYSLVCARLKFTDQTVENLKNQRGTPEAKSLSVYYKETKMPASKQTYENYLPFCSKDLLGNCLIFLSYLDSMHLNKDSNEFFIVYQKAEFARKSKAGGFFGWIRENVANPIAFGSAWALWKAGELVGVDEVEPEILTPEQIKQLEQPRIYLVNEDQLNSLLKGTELLTIPA